MKKIKHILTGWGKALGLLSVSTAEKKLSDWRLKQCIGCEHADTSKIMRIINGHASYERELVCGVCHCPCLEKSLVIEESCPVGKW